MNVSSSFEDELVVIAEIGRNKKLPLPFIGPGPNIESLEDPLPAEARLSFQSLSLAESTSESKEVSRAVWKLS
jgi:hypothetical protein